MSDDQNQTIYVAIPFKPYNRWEVECSEQLFRAALDSVGLIHIKVPEISRSLWDWGIEFKMSDIGDHLDEIINYLLHSGEMRYVVKPHCFTDNDRGPAEWVITSIGPHDSDEESDDDKESEVMYPPSWVKTVDSV